jgi:hypothetical protein
MPDEIQELEYEEPRGEDPLKDSGIEEIKYRVKKHYFVPTERGEKVAAITNRAKEITGAGVTAAKEVTTNKLIPSAKTTVKAVGSGTVKAAQALRSYQEKQKLKRELLAAQAQGYGYGGYRPRRRRQRVAYVDGRPVLISGQAPIPAPVRTTPDITAGMGGRMAPDITDIGASGAPSILGGMGAKSGILDSLAQIRGGSSGLGNTGKGSGLFSMPSGGVLSALSNVKKRRR